MILIVMTAQNIRQIAVTGTHCTIPVDGTEISMIQSAGRWHVHLPHALMADDHTLMNGVEMILKDRSYEPVLSLLMFENSTGFDEYRRYRSPGAVWICQSTDGGLEISGEPGDDILLSIHTDTHTIQCMDRRGAVNGKRLTGMDSYSDGDLISLLNLRLFAIGSTILINACKNLKVHLQTNVPHHFQTGITKLEMLKQIPSLDEPIETERKIVLPPLDHCTSFPEERPLLYTIGPSLMMAAASLSVGMISAWRSYMQGREVLDVLPMLLLPCVMVVCTLLWNPLAHHYEKKKRRKEKQRILDFDQNILANSQEQIRLWERNRRQKIEARFPYPERLQTLIKESPAHEIYTAEPLLLRAGDCRQALPVTFEMDQNEKDTELSEMLEEFQNSVFRESIQPCLLDLSKDRVIGIAEGTAQQDLFCYLVLQLSWVYGLKTAFLVKEKEQAQAVWIRKQAAWIHGKRMIFTHENQALEACQKNHLVLISEVPLSSPAANVLCLMKGSKNAMVILDPNQQICFDRLCHQKTLFSFKTAAAFDMNRLFDRMPFEGCHAVAENGFLAMYGCHDAASLNLQERWQRQDVNASLQAFLGRDDQNHLITLDLNEKKDGPHGLIAGMTGSGKSELIITMLLSLAVNYSPRDVQFALIDFKGGGISQAIGSGQDSLPHIAGILTNLDSEEMERALISFHQECIRRERLIASMNRLSSSPVMNLQDYRRCWSSDMSLPYLPDLIIVIDEFAELKRERPEFLKDLISIARIGRSLGVHLILSTQKPGGSVSDEIWTNCSFKICLKVSQRQDSYEMLHNEQACSLREAGSFLLLSDGGLRKGRAAYANMRHSLNPCRVCLYDETGKVSQDSSSFAAKGPPEILSILKEIHKQVSGYVDAQPLWLNPLPSRCVSSIPAGRQIYGQYDDFYHQRQPWLKLPETGSLLLITMDQAERKNMLQTLLYVLLASMGRNEELYLINDSGIETEEWRKIRMFTDSFSSVYEDKRKNIMDRIQYRKNTKERIVLMIDDLSVFLNSDAENSIILQNVLEQADSRHVLIILMNSVMQKVPYRIAGLITDRCVLHCEKPQEVQQVLECTGSHVQKKKGWGLLKKENVMEFRYLTCSEEEIRALAMKSIAMYGSEKTYCIPCMPEKISIHAYHGTRIPLGLKERDFTWCTIPPVETVSIVAMYPDELRSLHQILSPYSKCRYAEEADADDAQVLLMDYDSWMKERPETESVLLIGEAFRQQFVYRCRKKELKHNEGLFCHGHEREVIRIVEE